jgi:hypothetical protein
MSKRSKNKGGKDIAHGMLEAFEKQQREIEKRLKTKAGINNLLYIYLNLAWTSWFSVTTDKDPTFFFFFFFSAYKAPNHVPEKSLTCHTKHEDGQWSQFKLLWHRPFLVHLWY